MSTYVYPASLLCDFYKVSHREQYPTGTEYVYSTWTPRSSREPGIDRVVAFGFQIFIKEWLIDYFNQHFFGRPEADVAAEYRRVLTHTLGLTTPDDSHIRALHQLGYLPLKIKAVREGTLVPLRVPMLTVENTDPRFFWLTNYIETIMSAELWMPTTAATIAFEYLKLFTRWANLTDDDASFVPFQGHDFSMRGMVGVEACKLVGMGHLLSFVGTDTIPAILAHEEFYGANIETELVGTSVPATEHSVMSAGGKADELQTFTRLLTEVYPSGIVSIVSDTWDLWRVVGTILPAIKDKVMARSGKAVIRPDSGDPVDILCGDALSAHPLARKGVVECLWDIFGGTVSGKGYKKLDPHIGAIYGDSITPERARQICERLAAKGFASTNLVYGVGSYTYQFRTRDTFGMAMKATSAIINGVEHAIFKDPITDDGMKKSQCGRVIVYRAPQGITYMDGLSLKSSAHNLEDLLEDVFCNGVLLRDETLRGIRERLHAEVAEMVASGIVRVKRR